MDLRKYIKGTVGYVILSCIVGFILCPIFDKEYNFFQWVFVSLYVKAVEYILERRKLKKNKEVK